MNTRFGVWCLLLLAASPFHSRACDACGCSVSGPAALGLLPVTRGHFAGLSFQHQSFQSSLSGETVTQDYATLQAWGRYSLGDRFQLYGFVPYRTNYVQQNGNRTTSSGIGDLSLLFQTALLRRNSQDGQPAQTLLAGIGIKAPTGRHLSESDPALQNLPNSQPGTGAWDGQLAASYTLMGKRFGFNAEASYTLTTANKDDYKYGNRLGTNVNAFMRWRKGRFEYLPMAGGRYEFILHDYSRYSRRWLDTQTGGSVCYAQAGAQVYRGRFGFSVLWAQPVWQAPAGNLQTGSRLDGSLTFFL